MRMSQVLIETPVAIITIFVVLEAVALRWNELINTKRGLVAISLLNTLVYVVVAIAMAIASTQIDARGILPFVAVLLVLILWQLGKLWFLRQTHPTLDEQTPDQLRKVTAKEES